MRDVSDLVETTKAEGVSIDTWVGKATVIIVNTNELHHLQHCLPSVTQQTYPNYEVIVVDNCSTDGSQHYIQQNFADVRLIENKANLGYVGANNVGFQSTNSEFAVVLNPDTEVDVNWLSELVKAMHAHRDAGIATSKILMFDDHNRINTCGNDVSIIGIGFCRGVGKQANCYAEVDDVASASGASFIIRTELLNKIGGFDETFWAYVEDTDLSWRVQLAGYQCIFVPTSLVYHKYNLKLSARKFFFLDRNRYLLMYKHLYYRTMLVMLPVFFVSEIITWGYAVLRGRDYVRSKLHVYGWFWTHWKHIHHERKAVQPMRRIQDRVLLGRCTYKLGFQQADGGVIGNVSNLVFTSMLFALQKLVLAIVRW